MLWAKLLILSNCCFGAPGDEHFSEKDLDRYEAQVLKARQNCGPVSLWYCLRRFGKDVPVEQVLHQANLGDQGILLQDLLRLAESFGVPGEALRADKARLEDLSIPSIVLARNGVHCVVYDGRDPTGQQVLFFEPNEARVKSMPVEEFRKHWSGEVILFQPPQMSWKAFGSLVALSCMAVVLVGLLLDRWVRRRQIKPPIPVGPAG
jgi:ABC-type bacteriocin/lantibiotic exporter with double-glycine peptidase domain